jgi:hypothetical protein
MQSNSHEFNLVVVVVVYIFLNNKFEAQFSTTILQTHIEKNFLHIECCESFHGWIE